MTDKSDDPAQGENLKDITATTLEAFKNRVNTISEARHEWQDTHFATANEQLYQLLGKVYQIYLETKEGEEELKAQKDWLKEELRRRNIPSGKNAGFLRLITKFVFADGDQDPKRISSYGRVLSCADLEEVASGAEIPNYIKERGGIEAIRRKVTKGTKSIKERAEEGRYYADDAENIAVVKSKKLAHLVTAACGKYLVLLGRMNASGEIEIKHCVFEEDAGEGTSSSKTVIQGALSTLYAKKNKDDKEEEKKTPSTKQQKMSAIMGGNSAEATMDENKTRVVG